MSCVRLLRIEKRVLHIADHDLLDGSPVLDIKPYLPYCDSVPEAQVGYVESLPVEAGDHRLWWQDKSVSPPKSYSEYLGQSECDPFREDQGSDPRLDDPGPSRIGD
jgi:hypothetical protein